MPFAAVDQVTFTWSAASKIVSAGSNWTVSGTTNFSTLTIAAGAVVNAPDGKSLTIRVDGVEKPIRAGTYKGKIVLTVSIG